MSQDETFTQRKNRIKQALQPELDAALEDVAAALAKAQDAFSPSDPPTPPAEQGRRPHQPPDP